MCGGPHVCCPASLEHATHFPWRAAAVAFALMNEILTRATDALARAGVNTETFVSYAPPVIAAARPSSESQEELLTTALSRLYVQAIDAKVDPWSTLHFSAESIAETFAADNDAILGLFDALIELVDALANDDAKESLVLQRLGPSIRASSGKPWMAHAALDLARDLAREGADPAEAMRTAFPAIAEALADADAPTFKSVCDALSASFIAMDGRSIPPTLPIAEGVVALSRVLAGQAERIIEGLGALAELAITMHAHGHVPHPAIQYGLAPALEASLSGDWLRDEIFPIAFAIADEGLHPGLALERLPGVIGFGPIVGKKIAATLRTLGEAGRDVARLLAGLPAISAAASEDEARAEALFRRAVELLETLEAKKLRVSMAFEDGLPAILRHPVSSALGAELLEYAIALARAGIDPGPGLLHGVSPALHFIGERYADEEQQSLVLAIVSAAGRLLEAGIDPWRFLDPGIFAADRIATKDRQTFLAHVGEIERLAIDLHRVGIDPAPILMYGVRSLAIALTGQEGRSPAFTTALENLGAFAPRLKAYGIDPARAANHGLAAATRLAAESRAPWLISAAAGLGVQLAEVGIEPSGVLDAGLGALVRAIGSEEASLRPIFLDIVAAASRHGRTPIEIVITETLRSAPDPRAALGAALALIKEDASDATTLAAALVPVLAERDTLSPGLAAARLLLARHGAVDDRFASAAASAAKVCASEPDALVLLFETIEDAAAALSESLDVAAHAAQMLAGDRPEIFRRAIGSFAERARSVDQGALRTALRFSAWSAAPRAKGDAAALDRALDASLRLVTPVEEAGVKADEIIERLGGVICASAKDDVGLLARALNEAAELRAARRLDADVLYMLGSLRPLVDRLPAAWSDLIVPTLRAQTVSQSILQAFLRLERFIDDTDALSFLRHVTTQEGVRAASILWDLLVPGVERGIVRSMSAEKDVLLDFIRDLSIPDPSFYETYRAIATDATKGPSDRKQAVRALEARLRRIRDDVVAGEVPPERETDPLLGQAFFSVFPPAVSATPDAYLDLFRRRHDHADHAARFGRSVPAAVTLPRGGYRVRDGVTIDPAPWETLRTAIESVEASAEEEPLEPLGRDLCAAWIEGSLGTPKNRTRFLARIYRRAHRVGGTLAPNPTTADDYLAHREFLADTAREIVQEALRATRARASEHYDAIVSRKLSPRPFVGPGILRNLWKTIEAARANTIDASTARERVGRQLRGFEIDPERVLEASDHAALEKLLSEAPAKEGDVPLGSEHIRVLQEIAGQDLAAMQRELFGDSGGGKIEYREAAGKGLLLELAVTKRRAHTGIGFCEGVCTAVDDGLWDDPRFAHVVIWGPGHRALGGVHLLAVERPDLSPALALPGINPALELIEEAGAARVLDALFAHAETLAKENGFGALWIPDHFGIMSNRGPIQSAIAEKKLPSRAVPSTRFSSRPYPYTFDQVLVIWERP
jgi:hypothetical protein